MAARPVYSYPPEFRGRIDDLRIYNRALTLSVSVLVLPAASRAVTVNTFVPLDSAIPLTDQLVVPVAVPDPPRLFAQVTCVTPTLSDAVPLKVSGVVPVAKVAALVGPVIVTTGGVASAGGV